jgi:hypothetical protein
MLKIKLFYLWNIFRAQGFSLPKGCRRRDVVELEKEIGFPLPKTYRQFLRWMGADYKGIFVGSDCFISDVESNTRYLPELFEENNVKFDLAEHYVCFSAIKAMWRIGSIYRKRMMIRPVMVS